MHVAVHDAVDLAVERERHRVVFDVHDGHLVEPPRRQFRRDGVAFDAEQQRAWIEPPIGRAQRAGVAADIQHDAGAERDALQQIVVRLIGIWGHWRRTLRDSVDGGGRLARRSTVVRGSVAWLQGGRLSGITPQRIQPLQHPGTASVQCGGGGKLRRSSGGGGQGLRRLLDEPTPRQAPQR